VAELRQQVLRGGFYLVGRQAIALVVSVIGVTFLVRLIGPTNYGLFTGASSITFVLGGLGTYGLDVYLVRRERALTKEDYDQAFTLLAISAAVVGSAAFWLGPRLLDLLDVSRFAPPLRVLAFSLPFTLLAAPALASLERSLNYRVVAIIEMTGQFLYYGVALGLALGGAGLWSPVAAYFSWQVWLMGTTYIATTYRPALTWRRSLIRDMVDYGFSYSLSNWLWQLRGLVNPLVVGHFVGPAAVGFVGLAARLVEVAAFVRTAAWRLSIAAFGRVQRDYGRFRRVVEEAMALQVLAVAPLLAALGTVGPWLLPAVLGDRWHPVIRVFPYIALGMIFQAVFTMQTSMLYVVGRGRSVIPVNALHIGLFSGGALLCVPAFGFVGFGFAELIALAGYLLLDRQTQKVFRVSYADALPWVLAFTPPLFALYLAPAFVPVLWLPLAVIGLHPRQRRQIRGFLSYVIRRADEQPRAAQA
jgi:O-antigen/teichoic acid export membrane protein